MKRADMHTSLVMWHLVPSLILTRIDSCNSILINLPASTVAPLQRVENTAARLVLGLDRRAHITPALKKLQGFLSVNVSPSKSPPSCTVYFTRTVYHFSAIWLSLSTTTPSSVVFVQQQQKPPRPYGQINAAIAHAPLQHSPPGTVSHCCRDYCFSNSSWVVWVNYFAYRLYPGDSSNDWCIECWIELFTNDNTVTANV